MTYHSAALASEAIGSIGVSGNSGGEVKEQWFVVQTFPRCEGKVAAALKRASVNFWMPVETRKHRVRYTSIYREVTHPLLAGYLFVRMPKHGEWCRLIRDIDGVKDILGRSIANTRILGISDEDIMTLHQLCAAGALSPKKLERRPFKPKQRVRICAGPFAGFLATVDALGTRESAQVLFELFGRLTPVDIALADLAAV